MSLPSVEELRAALLPAVMGAALALVALAVFHLIRSWVGRRSAARLPDEVLVLRAESERVEQELKALTTEVETRLDVKLDHLESLLKRSNEILGPKKAPEPPRRQPGGQRWDAINTVSHADRNRVLELASLGELPESIAGSVGLLRGEVDLILRLHRSSERSQDASGPG